MFGRACANRVAELYIPGEFLTLPCIGLTRNIIIVIFSEDLKLSQVFVSPTFAMKR